MSKNNKSNGFLQYIIIIVIAISLMSWFNITIRDAFVWFIAAVKSVF
jgi:hypothetical protein